MFGFIHTGILYLIWCQMDSQFTGLGNRLLQQIKKRIELGTIDEWKDRILELKITTNISTKPTIKDIDANVNYRDKLTWYPGISDDGYDWSWCELTHKCKCYESIITSGYMHCEYLVTSDTTLNIFESSDAPYMYVLNFDTNRFEVYSYSKHNANVMMFDVNDLPNEICKPDV